MNMKCNSAGKTHVSNTLSTPPAMIGWDPWTVSRCLLAVTGATRTLLHTGQRTTKLPLHLTSLNTLNFGQEKYKK